MRTARWPWALVIFAWALVTPKGFAWSFDLCDWPTAAAAHQLGVETHAGEIATHMERIRQACLTHPEYSCSVVGRNEWARGLGPPKAALTLRLSAAGIEPISRIASSGGRITGQIMRNEDPAASTALSGWIAVESAHRARIQGLLTRADLTQEQLERLGTELKRVDERLSNLTAESNELRPRLDTDTLYVEVTEVRR